MIYFIAHTFKCVCHCRRAMFRVLGMYNFERMCKKVGSYHSRNSLMLYLLYKSVHLLKFSCSAISGSFIPNVKKLQCNLCICKNNVWSQRELYISSWVIQQSDLTAIGSCKWFKGLKIKPATPIYWLIYSFVVDKKMLIGQIFFWNI